MQLTEGHIVAEHYKLIRPLGQGSFGDVWLAHNQLADIDVAIKFYGTLDQKGLEEFRNEFKIAYRLHHPSLLNISHFDVYENCPYLVMPYCENGSVSSRIGHMPETEIWRFILDVSGGLAFLHSQQPPIVHQDIKPDNILITSDGRYVISDFGISRSFRTRMSRTNNNVSSSGTIAYMGPERFSEKPMVVLASDIWAFGMTLHEVITGDVLWEGMGGCVQLNGARLPVIEGAFSPQLKQLVAACLAAETWNRPTAVQIHDYAAAYQQHKPLPQLSAQQQASPTPQQPAKKPVSPIRQEPAAQPIQPRRQQPHYPQSGQPRPSHAQTSSPKPQPSTLKSQIPKRALITAAAVLAAAALITGAVSIISTISEEQAFVSCRTKQDYEQFIRDYPTSSYLETARKRIAAMSPQEPPLQAEESEAKPTQPEAQSAAAGKGEPASIVRLTETPAAAEPVAAKPAPPVDAVPAPSAKPATPAAKQPQADADDQAFYSCSSPEDYHAYLNSFPNGRHRQAATERLTSMLNQTNANDLQLTNTGAEVPPPAGGSRWTDGPAGSTSRRSISIGVGGGQRGGYRGGRGPQRSYGGQPRGAGQRNGESPRRHFK